MIVADVGAIVRSPLATSPTAHELPLQGRRF
jgi:hypothetical protein